MVLMIYLEFCFETDSVILLTFRWKKWRLSMRIHYRISKIVVCKKSSGNFSFPQPGACC